MPQIFWMILVSVCTAQTTEELEWVLKEQRNQVSGASQDTVTGYWILSARGELQMIFIWKCTKIIVTKLEYILTTLWSRDWAKYWWEMTPLSNKQNIFTHLFNIYIFSQKSTIYFIFFDIDSCYKEQQDFFIISVWQINLQIFVFQY